MGSWRICDGEYQLYKILMAARHSNSQLEAISKTSNSHRRRWFDNFQGQKSVVYHLNRSHHFLPDEIQRLSFGPSSKNLILDTLWFHEFSDDFFFLIRILKILPSTFDLRPPFRSLFVCVLEEWNNYLLRFLKQINWSLLFSILFVITSF